MEEMCFFFQQHLLNDPTCSGLTELLVHLTKRDPFRTIFAKQIGTRGLEHSLIICGQSILTNHSHSVSPFDEGTFDPLPDSARDWLGSSAQGPLELPMMSESNPTTPPLSRRRLSDSSELNPVVKQGKLVMVPKLPLPNKPPESPLVRSRYTRRLSVSSSSSPYPDMVSRASFSSHRGSFRTEPQSNTEESAKKQLHILASSLGETYMAADLSSLLPYLPHSTSKTHLDHRIVSPTSLHKDKRSVSAETQVFENVMKIITNITSSASLIQVYSFTSFMNNNQDLIF